MREKWKTIKGSSKYEVSNEGRVRNKRSGLILKEKIDRYGYPTISVINDRGKKIYRTAHRYVAENWIPNPKKLPQVNHINGDKTFNHPKNLEWVSAKDNVVHSFVNLLNTNTSHVSLFDLVTSEETFYRSVKDLGRKLGIFASSIIPLIKMSELNPVLGRYVIKLHDEAAMDDRSNTRAFGRRVFVYDEVTDKKTFYSSVLLAAYHTGVRALSNLKTRGVLRIAGYQLSFFEEDVGELSSVSKDELLEKRRKYLLTPYRSIKLAYSAYDYYTKEEFKFNSLPELAVWLDQAEPKHRRATRTSTSTALGQCGKAGKTGLHKGYGIKSDLYEYDWFPYTEETILSNRNGFKAPHIFYRITRGSKSELVIGHKMLCQAIGYRHDKSFQSFDYEVAVKSLNDPNLSVKRLNKPIP